MLRYLCGLNEADALEELRKVGADDSSLPNVTLLRERFTVKLAGYTAAQVKEIERWLQERAPGTVVLRGEAERGVLLGLPPAQLPELRAASRDSASSFLKEFKGDFLRFLENVERSEWHYRLPGNRPLRIDRPLVMGILNVTPDSFSDGGRFFSPEASYRQAREMLEAGADVIDIGGESTRPGAESVTVEEEWRRVGPVVRRLQKVPEAVISIDTYKSEVARRALNEGAHIINDISALGFDPDLATVAAQWQAPLILMHIRGRPRTMQKNPVYRHLLEEVYRFLSERCRAARQAGVSQLIVDPGIGFGKKFAHNVELIRRLGELRALGYPILLGASRKAFLGHLLDAGVEERLMGTVASALYGVWAGANILRVHDVREICQSLKVMQAIQRQKAL